MQVNPVGSIGPAECWYQMTQVASMERSTKNIRSYDSHNALAEPVSGPAVVVKISREALAMLNQNR